MYGCNATQLSSPGATNAIGGLVAAATVNQESIAAEARRSAEKMDAEAPVAGPGNPYHDRLMRLVANHQSEDGLALNYKVYLADELNAFAMPDGSVRVYSGLMDVMPDDQLLAVIGHEIGHVKLGHSLAQYRKALLAASARSAASASGTAVGQIAGSELGAVGEAFLGAQFSQRDELSADTYGMNFLKENGYDASAAVRAFQTLAQHAGEGGGLMSSHPATSTRVERMRNQL